MTTFAEAEKILIDAAVACVAPSPVAIDNVAYEALSAGADPFLAVNLHWGRTVQAEINPDGRRRQWGSLGLGIHVAVGAGPRPTSEMLQKVVDTFAARTIQSITFPELRVLRARELGRWYVSDILVSFFFDF